jgi:hypothetical protein
VTYDVLLTDEANRALERLPGPEQDVVLEALDRDLPRLEKQGSRGQLDDVIYVQAPITPVVQVFFRRIPDDELRQLQRDALVRLDATVAYVVLVLETG